MVFLVKKRGIISYQVITGYYDKVVYLKALIPFFGMGLSFISIYLSTNNKALCPGYAVQRGEGRKVWKQSTITESD